MTDSNKRSKRTEESPLLTLLDKRTEESRLLTLLDEDSLLQVLMRVPAKDHAALRKTCTTLEETVNSDAFRKLRVQSEWAEIEVTLWASNTRRLDVITKHFCFTVDGVAAGGSGDVQLVNRRTWSFHGVCDRVSQLAGCTFFDNRGRPRVHSVKQALEASGADSKKPLLYITIARWRDPGFYFRNSTWVGASVIRSLFSIRESRVNGPVYRARQ
jgi:hypothetical protein